jgi:hypothetical protein
MGMQISYKGFCALGALTNPKLYTRTRYNGRYFYTTYHLISC